MDGSMKRIISTKTAPQTSLPISQANVFDKTVYVSGCLGFELASGKIVPGGAKEQTEAALNHMENILLAAGTNMKNVVKTTIYLQNYGDFASVNEAYKEAFSSNFPARTCIEVAKLPMNALVEIDGIAIIGETNGHNSDVRVNSKL